MSEPQIKATLGTYQYFDGTSTEFVGTEVGISKKSSYIGTGLNIATDGFKNNSYGLFDIKGKVKYNKYLDSNMRIRTAFDKDIKSTQIRMSPLSVNVPISKNISIYSNTHYSGKYNYKTDEFKHSVGNFTGVSLNINEHINLEGEIQRYNLQDITDNSSQNWGCNVIVSYKF